MIKIAFVVLNYNTFQETKECIFSIRKHIDVREYIVIVVDNASDDDSLRRLRKEFSDELDVDIIANEKNMGFARGNNVGITYANERYMPEFIAVNNSDTEIFQDDLYQKLSSEYIHSHFALLGPMILLPNGRCDESPWKPITLNTVKDMLDQKKREKRILDSKLLFLINKVKKAVCRICPRKRHNDNLHVHLDFWKYQTQVELQGAFLFFSRDAFRYIDGFDERTFLYFEEQLLFLSLIKQGQTIVYDPRIAVYHKEAQSTKKIKGTKIEKFRFINKCNLESLEILYNTLLEMKVM